MNRDRRRILQGMAASVLFPALGPSRAQVETSSKSIRLVVPYPPGGFTDILARLLAAPLGAKLGTNVIVDNRSGGAGTIGTSYVVRSPADGKTLGIVANDLAINETLMAGRVPYDARKDLAPVAHVALSPMVLVINPKLPIQSFSELISTAKSRPGSLTFGSTGNGTGGHLALAMLNLRAKIDIAHIPYRGNGPAIQDLVGGQFHGMFIQRQALHRCRCIASVGNAERGSHESHAGRADRRRIRFRGIQGDAVVRHRSASGHARACDRASQQGDLPGRAHARFAGAVVGVGRGSAHVVARRVLAPDRP